MGETIPTEKPWLCSKAGTLKPYRMAVQLTKPDEFVTSDCLDSLSVALPPNGGNDKYSRLPELAAKFEKTKFHYNNSMRLSSSLAPLAVEFIKRVNLNH